jgi:hypothetical protein
VRRPENHQRFRTTVKTDAGEGELREQAARLVEQREGRRLAAAGLAQNHQLPQIGGFYGDCGVLEFLV